MAVFGHPQFNPFAFGNYNTNASPIITGGVEIDWSNSITRELKSYFNLTLEKCLVSDIPIENFNGNATRVPEGYKFNGSSSILKINHPIYDVDNIDSNGLTVLVRFKGAAQNDKRVFCFGGTGSLLWALGSDSASPYTKLRCYSTIDWQTSKWSFDVSTKDCFDDNWHTAVLVFPVGGSSDWYIDGEHDSTHAKDSSSGTDPTPYSAIGAYIRGNNPDGGAFFNGEIALTALWYRAINAEEARALSGNPFQILRPAGSGLYANVDAAGPAGDTSKNLLLLGVG